MRAKDILNKYGITRNTLTNWVKSGRILYRKTKSGRYIYIDNDNKSEIINERLNIIYARVSTTGQTDNLKRQVERLKDFCGSNGYIIDEVLTEVASGMNYNRKKYTKLINLVLENKVGNIFIEYEDRLTRFGFVGLKNICEKFNTKIIIINKSENKDQLKEITDDLVLIIHHFSSKMYSLRKNKHKILTIISEDN